jgi:hypothetical protein
MRLIYFPHERLGRHVPGADFTLLMLIVAVSATALVVGSVRSYWHKLRAGPRLAPDDAPKPTRADVVLVAGLADGSVGG